MKQRAHLAPGLVKVLIIAACWTSIVVFVHLTTFLHIGDLIRWGTLSGEYAFWPDLVGNTVVGMFGGLVGGFLLVFKVNAGYRHKTFLSGIIRAVVFFSLIYLVSTVTILAVMSFVFRAPQAGAAPALRHAWDNVVLNVRTPSFLVSMAIFGLLVSGTQFLLQVNDKFGRGVLWKLVTGRYYHPREEERIFMFLDLRSSTEIAERLGHYRFFELLKELFQDITEPVIESLGDIHQYVGDEVIITWPIERGLSNDNCIECFFRIEKAIAAKRSAYLERFGLVPAFKAGVHVGTATVGEIGVIKKDIVYSGDVLNTTSRIQQECNRHNVDLLVSGDLLDRMRGATRYAVESIGQIQLRGKADPLAVSTVRAS